MIAAPITRRDFTKMTGLFVAGAVVSGSAAMPARPAVTRKPNVLFILADDMGFECFHPYGGESYSTPHLDRLAREGMVLEHCYATPFCTPARVSLMTGKYGHRNYVKWGYLPPRERTFAHMLKEQGYKTCIAGKWQLGEEEDITRAGFDDYCLPKGHLVDVVCNTKRKGAIGPGYAPDLFSDYLIEFMTENKDAPFLAYYPMRLNHGPFFPNPNMPEYADLAKRTASGDYFAQSTAYMDKMVGKLVGALDDLGIRENTIVLFTGDNGAASSITSRWKRQEVTGGKGGMSDFATRVPLYACGKTKTPAGAACDTLVDFSDFYATMADGRVIGGRKASMNDAGTHVAFIARWKGVIPPGTVRDDPMTLCDVYPTLADVAGIDVRQRNLDGASMFPAMQGQEGPKRAGVFMSFKSQWPNERTGKHDVSAWARNRRWRLYDDGRIYDLDKDPDEQTPATGPEAEEMKANLRPAFVQVSATPEAMRKFCDRNARSLNLKRARRRGEGEE